jgi:ferredoxin
MKVRQIPDKCCGHARCATYSPEIYVLDDDGYLAIDTVEVPADSAAAALRGAKACPERAIEVIEDQPPEQGR